MRCGQFVTEHDAVKHFGKHLLEVAALVLGAVLVSTLWRLITR
jgi:hypothetical protein